MANIFVSGVINIENSMKIDSFPINYSSVEFKTNMISTNVGGVGFNVAKALKVLNNDITFCSLTGDDTNSYSALSELSKTGISAEYIDKILPATPQSIILYDNTGQRQINTDLKGIFNYRYNINKVEAKLPNIDLAVLTNVNYSRYLIDDMKKRSIKIACDIQAIDSIDNEYNQNFMKACDILFLSADRLQEDIYDFINTAFQRYSMDIIAIGLGKDGVLISKRGEESIKLDAPRVEKVENTVGAGDALFASFINFYLKSTDYIEAMEKALIFVGEKIQHKNSATGYKDEYYINKKYYEKK